MSASNRSKLLSLTIKNIGCIGEKPVKISLDKVVCLVGKNNSGKTTVLRAYELARGDEAFISSRDRSLLADKNSPSEIILDIHIPENIANINHEWKIIDGDLKIVRSRWQWLPPDYKVVRTTWHPKGGDDEKGGGLKIRKDWREYLLAAGGIAHDLFCVIAFCGHDHPYSQSVPRYCQA